MAVLRRDEAISDVNINDVHTVLGPESTFEGKLVFDGTVRIDGKFKGEIQTDNILVVGQGCDDDVYVLGLLSQTLDRVRIGDVRLDCHDSVAVLLFHRLGRLRLSDGEVDLLGAVLKERLHDLFANSTICARYNGDLVFYRDSHVPVSYP